MSQWREYFQYLRQRMFRQRDTDPGDLKTELNRCLSTLQLTFLGVGNTIGVGIYVLLGVIAKDYAGPSTILCFVIAIVVTLMNALVYSEFSSSVTQTGASYIFVYKVAGEFLAFLCGWLMLISSLASACVGARAWSGLLDSMFDHRIQNYTTSTLGNIQFGRPFADSLDLVAFGFQVALTVIVSCNVRCSSILNTALSVLTISVLVFVAVAGPIFGDVNNFLNKDNGGFFPFGIMGVVKGSSLAVYACSGFEVVAMTAEEAKDPQKSIPRAIILELTIVALVYVGATIGILFLIPYSLLNTSAPLPTAFGYKGMVWGKFFVTLGPLFSFSNLQMLNLYGSSRIMYRMASDGLFFQFFLKVNKKTGVPVNSVILIGTLTAVLSLMFELSYLVEMTILLMLITFIFLGSALIKLKVNRSSSPKAVANSESDIPESVGCENRNSNGDVVVSGLSLNGGSGVDNWNKEEGDRSELPYTSEGNDNDNVALLETNDMDDIFRERTHDESNSEGEDDVLFKQQSGSKRKSQPKDLAVVAVTQKSKIRKQTLSEKCSLFVPGVFSVNLIIFLHWVCCVGLAMQINYGWKDLWEGYVVALVACSLLIFMLVVLTTLLWILKTEDPSFNFKTPLMPLVPTLSILFSSILFFSSAKTVGFIEMAVLVIIGSILYFVLVCLDMRAPVSERRDTEQTLSLMGDDQGSDDDEL